MKSKDFFDRQGSFLKEAFVHWQSFRPTRMAASLSYYGLFALVPILVIVFWIGTLLLHTSSIQEDIIAQTSSLLGVSSAAFIQTTFTSLSSLHGQPLELAIAIIALLLLAYHGADELRQSLDDIWKAPKQKNSPLVLISRFGISLLAILVFGVIFIAFITITRFLQGNIFLSIHFAFLASLTTTLEPFILFIISFLGTLTAYLILPDALLKTKALFAGAAVTAVLLSLGSFVLSYYFAQDTSLSVYGVAESIFALLLWLYYSSLIFLYGASLTWVISKK